MSSPPGSHQSSPGSATRPTRPLLAVKILHTIIWVFFVAAILGIWIAAALNHLAYAAGCVAIVLVEVLVLLFNRWKCPLTAVAGRYTDDRRANFDIFLPEWLARNNKVVFGSLFVLGSLFLLARWLWAA